MSESTRKGPHPFWFFLLVLPFGMSFGYVGIGLPFLGSIHHIEPKLISNVVALAFVPHTWKFFWAPVVDTTLTRKTWYLLALAMTMAGTIVSAAMPIDAGSLTQLALVVILSQVGLTLLGMACEGFLALTVPEAEKGRASGWYQGGNFFGVGIGGWAALRLQSVAPGWAIGVIMGGAMAVSAIGLLFIPKLPPKDEHDPNLARAMKILGLDLWGFLKNWRVGVTGIIICVSPVGAGALSAVLNGIPEKWNVLPTSAWHYFGMTFNSADVVGLINGLLGGIISMFGCMVGGYLADKMNRRLAYALAGVGTALTAAAMGFAPREPWAYIFFSLVYAFFNGVAYAAFTSFVLETIGKGAAATKYNIFASLANFAVSYMIIADGYGNTRWGVLGALFTDSLLTLAGVAVLILMVFIVAQFPPKKATAPDVVAA